MHSWHLEVAVHLVNVISYTQVVVNKHDQMESIMTTQFNGTEFTTVETRRFAPAFEGAQAKREFGAGTLLTRRTVRRSRRENRAL